MRGDIKQTVDIKWWRHQHQLNSAFLHTHLNERGAAMRMVQTVRTEAGPNDRGFETQHQADLSIPASQPATNDGRLSALQQRAWFRVQTVHAQTPYIRRLQLPGILIILLLIVVNLAVWAVCGLILATKYTHLLSTAALAYSLGLRHALDADHISAIDLMTRRLIATGQKPVTVGTFFSLGHSTVVVLTSIVVAATAAGVSKKFDRFSTVGGIIGTSVSAAFLIALGLMNGYIMYKLVIQLRKVIRMQPDQEQQEAWKVEGGGILFRILKRMFKLIDRPWKMYPLGFLFGLGFDTSSEIALLGIASIQGAKGTSMWLILVFPILFTVGMCLVDTIDGALMSSLYLAPMSTEDLKDDVNTRPAYDNDVEENQILNQSAEDHNTSRVRSPLTFLYYSTILTALTVVVALVIGVIQLLSLLLNVAVSDEAAKHPFWRGVEAAGEYYDIIGAAICGSFVIVGIASVVCYKPWRRWVDRERSRLEAEGGQPPRGQAQLLDVEQDPSTSKIDETRLSSKSSRTFTTAEATLDAHLQEPSGCR